MIALLFRSALMVCLVWGAAAILPAAATAQAMEYNTDRLGGDFDRITLHISDPKACQAICQSTEQCVAWTYTPIGFNEYQTPQCWLKDQQTRPFERLNVTSGVIPTRFAASEKSADLPERSATGASAWAECSNPDNWLQPDVDLSKYCMQERAAESMDSTICAAIPDATDRQACFASAGLQVMQACNQLDDPEKQQICLMAVSVEFPDPKSCLGAPDNMKLQCHVTVAAETGDHSAFLQELNYVSDEDRDVWIGSLAVTTQDYDLLELIRDNATYDKILIAVAMGRIASGKYVERGICSTLAGGYDDPFGDDLSAADNRALCVEGVALARVFTGWAEDKTIEEILEMQDQLEAYANLRAETDIDPEFPEGLGGAMEREMQRERGGMQSATVTQSGQLPEEAQVETPPSTSDFETEYEVPYSDDCIFGVCPD